MKTWYVSVAALFFVAVAFVAFAAPPDPGSAGPRGPEGMRGPAGHEGRFGSYLNLTQEQMDKMREIRNRYYTDTHDLRYDMLQKKLELRKLVTDPKATDAALLAKQKELSALRLKLADMRAQIMIQERKVLTPEQIQKLDRMPMGHGHRMGGGHMGFGPGMAGPGAGPCGR